MSSCACWLITSSGICAKCWLMERDEAGTLAAPRERRKGVLTPLIGEHHGRDGVFAVGVKFSILPRRPFN
jgi:hypothetical protein